MIDVMTKSGFTFSVDPAKLDDWDFMQALADSDSENAALKLKSQIYIVKHLLGEDEERLKKHLSKESGHAPASRMVEEALEIMQLAGEHPKKSSSSPA